MTDIRLVNDLESMLIYFSDKLKWNVDLDSFDIEDVTYDFNAADINLKEEEFSKIKQLRQLRPLSDNQPWGIFAIEFDSKRFEVTALRKVLSGLIPKRRNSNHATWNKKNLLFLCFWGNTDNRTIGVAYFEDSDTGLPKIKITYCNPKVEDFTQLDSFENKLSKLTWPEDISNHDIWREQWSEAFTTIYRQTIRDSATLISELATVAKKIRQQLLDIMQIETASGYVHLLYEKFKYTLIHDMTPEQFADMYAQTITYGLFSARCMDNDESFDPQEAIKSIPNTNPFLKKLLQECLSQHDNNLSFDELELSEIIELLRNTNTDSILDDFNRQTGGGKEDPVIYFYEGFLNSYESEQKKRRGVYYTPLPVVNFIVRAVDEILKTEFGFEDGLASTDAKTVTIKRDSRKRVNGFIKQVEDNEEVPAIQILDPATGTGTFLRQTILQIWANFKSKYKNKSDNEIKDLWNEYVPKHLLPRLNGFELMMAPYAVAHMKLAMVLKETGYNFCNNERVKVFLTNSLEEGGNTSEQTTFLEDPLASEAIEANKEKKNRGINIVIGNPPYSGESANKNKWIKELMEDYKKEPGGMQKLRERNPKWLNDDYVKFIRYAQLYIERAGAGIVAFINPHGFIVNPTFRGMRWKLIQTFDRLYIIDLHGNSNRNETSPNGQKDENVFDIQQGVSINVFVKYRAVSEKSAEIYHGDIWGSRNDKYNILSTASISNFTFCKVKSCAPEFLFISSDIELKGKYNCGFNLNEIFPVGSVGVVTAKDKILIDIQRDELLKKVSQFYTIKPKEAMIKPIYYRPFDTRLIYYDTKLLERGRKKVMQHFFEPNIGIVTARSNKSGSCDHFLVSKAMTEAKCGERTTQSAVFPLFIYEQTLDNSEYKLNFNETIVQKICETLGMDLSFKSELDKASFSPIDLFDYIYAVLYSPRYRDTYEEFLKIDFPRIPYPTDQKMFREMVGLGCGLRSLHLMESSVFNAEKFVTSVEIKAPIEKVEYCNGRVYINKTEFFTNVPRLAWEFCIGGYRPAQKWLKDRKGKLLTEEDCLHYQKIILALTETERIMKKIDEIFKF